MTVDVPLSAFLVQSALLGWFGGLASLKHYGSKALWQYGNTAIRCKLKCLNNQLISINLLGLQQGGGGRMW